MKILGKEVAELSNDLVVLVHVTYIVGVILAFFSGNEESLRRASLKHLR